MLNTGKESHADRTTYCGYHKIPIPEERLLAAIEDGIRKKERQDRSRRIQRMTAAAAVFFLLLFGCANIPVLYSYASEIPIVRTFVQAFRVGSGGVRMDNVTAKLDSDAGAITISFEADGKTTEEVLAYSTAYYHAPSRLQMTFHGMDGKLFSRLQEKLMEMEAIQDVYRIESAEKTDFAFVMVLNGLYNYELMEFSHPGSLTLRFYQDAYYAEGETHPGQTVYFLRSKAIPSERKMKKLLEKYQEEKPSQIRNRAGECLLVIGEYDTKEEAEAALSEIEDKYGAGQELAVGWNKAEEIPE